MTREQYLTTIRALYEKEGCCVEHYEGEADYVSDLAEDGWPDHELWLGVWNRIHAGGEMTPRERECAIAYFVAGEEYPPDDMRLRREH